MKNDMTDGEYANYHKALHVELLRMLTNEESSNDSSLIVESAYRKVVAEKVGEMSEELQFCWRWTTFLVEQEVEFTRKQGVVLQDIFNSPWGKRWIKEVDLNQIEIFQMLSKYAFKPARSLFNRYADLDDDDLNKGEIPDEKYDDFIKELRTLFVNAMDDYRKKHKDSTGEQHD